MNYSIAVEFVINKTLLYFLGEKAKIGHIKNPKHRVHKCLLGRDSRAQFYLEEIALYFFEM